MRFIQRNRTALEWACPSVARSSKRTEASCGQHPIHGQARRFSFACHSAPAMTDGDLVLVVDDDPSIRDSLRSLIRSLGLRCQTFASADELFPFVRPASAACVILDVQLPGRSGLELAQDLARSGIDIPIIFLTGHGTIPMSVRA